MKALVLATAAILLLTNGAQAQTPSPPQPPPPYAVPPEASPDRSGFTAGLTVGLGATRIAPEVGDSDTKGGLAGVNLDLGTYWNPDEALLFRASGSSYTQDIDGSTKTFTNSFMGLALQYWIRDNVSLSGGIGFAFLTVSFESDREVEEVGFGVNARVNYRISGGWQLAADLTPSFYDGATVYSSALLGGYQWD